MPFQSEKQRRFLHANHPEIAKRWEREYATGGISNHFRKKFASGTWTPGAGRDTKGYQSNHPSYSGGNGGGGDGPKPHSGPTFAEIQAQKKAALAKQKAHDDAKHVAWLNQQRENKKEKVKRFKKLVDTKGYYSDKATDEETKLYDDWLIATGQKEKMTHPVLLNSRIDTDIRQKNGKSKSFHKMKSSIEDLITGDINRETNIVTPELGTISTHMGPTGIQVQTGGDKYGTIENIPLSATQSWAVNPGKPRDDNFSDIQGHQAGLTKKQKQALDTSQRMGKDFGNFTNEQILENIQMWDDPDDPATIKDIETFYSAKGGVARKNYFHGGILDINESEEIISDDGNDIELTAYNAAFDEPTGVKSLFRAKDGGRIGFFTGMREAEQKEAQKDTGGGYQSVHDTGAVTQTPGRRTAQTVPSGINIHKDPDRIPEAFIMVDGQEIPQSLWGTSSDPRENPNRRTKYGANYKHPFNPEKKVTYEQREVLKRIETKLKGDWQKYIDPTLVDQLKLVSSLTGITGILTAVYKQMKTDKEMREMMELMESIGLAKGPPGTNDPLYDRIWLYQEKKKAKYRKDDEPDDRPEPIYAPLTGAVGEEYAQGYYGYPDSDLDRIRAGQAQRAMINPDWQEQPGLAFGQQLFNSGGLANLFRVKNQ